jgi:hypothetical protein
MYAGEIPVENQADNSSTDKVNLVCPRTEHAPNASEVTDRPPGQYYYTSVQSATDRCLSQDETTEERARHLYT